MIHLSHRATGWATASWPETSASFIWLNVGQTENVICGQPTDLGVLMPGSGLIEKKISPATLD